MDIKPASQETILVIEDSRQIAAYLRDAFLPSLGYQVKIAPTGGMAFETLRLDKFSLILLDFQLPDMSGLELLQKLQPLQLGIPIIFMTAFGSEEIAAEAFRLGVNDYLIKPLDNTQLEASINRALSESRLRRETEKLTIQLKEQVSWMSTMAKVGQSVTSTLDLNEVLRRIVEASVQLTQADVGFLALLDTGNNQLYLRALVNVDENKFKTLRLPVNDSLIGMALKTGQPVRTSHRSKEKLYKLVTGFLVQSLLHVPILSRGRPLGVLSVINDHRPHDFKPVDETILIALADYAAVAIENASLYEHARQEITERKRVEAALRESEKRYALAVNGAMDGIWDWDLFSNRIYFSPRWKEMLGFTSDEIGDTPSEWLKRLHPDDLEHTKQAIATHLSQHTPHLENVYRILHRDGTYRWMLCRGLAIWESDGRPSRIAGSQTDITEQKAVEEKLRRNALYDGLTGLANRALLVDRLTAAIERKKRQEKYTFAVLFMDLDRFKDVNDSLGHLAGDQLLLTIGKQLREGLRATDLIARIGGDEFVVLLEDVANLEAATRVARWILDQIITPIRIRNQEVFVSTSIGIVLSTANYRQAEEMLRDADIALYVAKDRGRARYEVFDPMMRDRLMKRLAIESELRQAIEGQKLRVFYQPVVDLRTGGIAGVEAVLQWDGAVSSSLLTSTLLEQIKESGLLLLIDHWTLNQACLQVQAWQAQYSARPLFLAVNMSAETLGHPNFLEQFQTILTETGLEADSLQIEISENTLNQVVDTRPKIFSALQDMGIKIIVDDFGSGFSSLQSLSRLPIHALKISPAFTHQISRTQQTQRIVQAIIQLSHDLEMKALASGIEVEDEYLRLKALQCDYGQGAYFSGYIDQVGVAEWLDAQFRELMEAKREWSPLPSNPGTPGGPKLPEGQ